MVNGIETNIQGTRTDLGGTQKPFVSNEQRECEAQGGRWDLANQKCIMPEIKVEDVTPKPTPPPPKPGEPVVLTKKDVFGTERPTGFVDLPTGQEFFGLNPQEVEELVRQQTEQRVPAGAITREEVLRRQEEAARGAQLAGQVGQIQPSPTEPSPGLIPGVSQAEAFTQATVGSVPSAIRLSGQAAIGAAVLAGAAKGAAAGAPGAPATGGLSIAGGAAIGAAVGFVAGIAGGMISNTKSQRTDDTTAQQRVLDEGKQTLMDWVTLARADPANRHFYLKQYNIQSQLIQDAHVQMLTDVNADTLKFETAIPNLEEFNTFYSVGGERDALDNEMRNALQTPSGVDFEMLALTERRSP